MDGPGLEFGFGVRCGPFRPRPTRHRPAPTWSLAAAGLASSCLANAARSSRLPLASIRQALFPVALGKAVPLADRQVGFRVIRILSQSLHGLRHDGIAGLEMLDFMVASQYLAAELRIFRAPHGSRRQLGKLRRGIEILMGGRSVGKFQGRFAQVVGRLGRHRGASAPVPRISAFIASPSTSNWAWILSTISMALEKSPAAEAPSAAILQSE